MTKRSFALRVAAVPALILVLYFAEARHAFAACRLIAFIAAFLLAADLAALLRGRLRDGFAFAAAVALGLGLFEGAALLFEQPRDVKVSGALWVPKPDLGWGAKAPGRVHAERTDPRSGATIYSADYTIDDNLLRQTKSCDGGRAVVFFGCSFTFGDGVGDDDTMPQAFADLLDRRQRVVNLGYEGYGPQQFLRALETGLYDWVIGPSPAAFVFLTAPWHAERTACKAAFVLDAPRYALEDGRVVQKGACAEGFGRKARDWLQGSAAYRVFIDPLRRRLGHDDVELYLRILIAAVDLAKQNYGAPTFIPYLRGGDGYLDGTGFDDDAIVARLTAGGAIVVEASLAHEKAEGALIEIAGDNHPTPLAHRLRARQLRDAIERRRPGMLEPRQQSRLD